MVITCFAKFVINPILNAQARETKPVCKVTKKVISVGEVEHRSPYLPHAKRALYHLSYIPGDP